MQIIPLDIAHAAPLLLRVIVAVLVSGLVGIEREHHNRPAGLRTHILVGLGAAVVALIESEHAALIGTSGAVSVGRMTAQVISGIGFLGAGTIIVQKGAIKGLTTAASLWNVACLGVAAGYGYVTICIIGVAATLSALTLIRNFLPYRDIRSMEISFPIHSDIQQRVDDMLKEQGVIVRDFQMKKQNDNMTCVYLLTFRSSFNFTGFREEILGYDEVISFKMTDE